jgi:hypothetical protein
MFTDSSNAPYFHLSIIGMRITLMPATLTGRQAGFLRFFLNPFLSALENQRFPRAIFNICLTKNIGT